MQTAITKVSADDFHATLQDLTRAHNAGVTVQSSTRRDSKVWLIRGVIVGLTRGPIGASRDYFIETARA